MPHLGHFGLETLEFLVDPLVLLQLGDGGPFAVQVRAAFWGKKRRFWAKTYKNHKNVQNHDNFTSEVVWETPFPAVFTSETRRGGKAP